MRTLALHLAFYATLAGATSTALTRETVSKMFNAYGELVRGLYNRVAKRGGGERYAECRKLHGGRCCPGSSCWTVAGQGCSSKRGPTTCSGAQEAPLAAGVCTCEYGACDSRGVCSQDPLTWKLRQEKFALNATALARAGAPAGILRGPAGATGLATPAVGLAGLAGLVAALGLGALAARRLQWAHRAPATGEARE